MVIVDGIEYKVNVIKPSRELSFEITEGKNTGMSLAFREIRDIGGTKYNYTMRVEPMRDFPEDFDALFWALSAPVNSHRVVMPFAQSTLEFDALIRTGRIIDGDVSGEFRRWYGMEITFEAIEPQRKPEG